MSRKPHKQQPKVRCAVYTRKSTDENLNLDFNSLDAQREAGEAYIRSQQNEGWTCADERYDDGGYTGGNTDRPAFQRLMQDVADGKVDCIVVYKIDRLSRSLMDFAQIMETLDANGVSLVSVTQQFNTTSSMGRLTLNILLSFAQFEREIISERTRDKIAAARRKGKWTGGAPVLGYDRVRDNRGTRIEVNKAEAERVWAIFKMYLDEGSMLATAKTLRALGWKTKKYQTAKGKWRGGADFDKATLHKMLTNVTYLGKVTYKGDVFEGEHDAIVDEDLFARVQGLIARNRNTGGKHVRNKYGALLKGLVRCKHCGGAMGHHYSQRGNKRYRYYVCIRAQKNGWSTCPSPSLPAVQLEDFVVEQIKSVGRDPGVLADSLIATQQHMQAEVDALVAERKQIEDEVRKHGRAVGELAPRAGFDEDATRQLGRLQDLIRERHIDIAGLNEKIAVLEQRMLEPDELAGAIESFDPLWESLPPAHKEKLIRLLIERVEYDGTDESISVTFHPTGIRTLTQQHQEADA